MASSLPKQGRRLTLTDMPNEVLYNIASHIEGSHHRFVQTSKRCQTAGELFLYQKWEETGEYRESNKDIYLYLRALIHRPDLAKHVKSFSGASVGYEEEISEEWEEDKDGIFNESDWERLESVVKSKWREHEHVKMLGALKKGEWEPAIAILFSLMSNLEAIKCSAWNECGPILSGYLQQAAVRQRGYETTLDLSSSLPLLNKVALEHYDTEGHMDTEELDIWGALRSVRMLEAHMVGTEASYEYDSEFPDGKTLKPEDQNSCLVETLKFTYSGIDAYLMADFLGGFPRLKHLAYEHGGAVVADASFEPPQFRRALLEVKNTLESLLLADIERADYHDLSEYPLGSLKEFVKLKVLVIEVPILLGSVNPFGGNTAMNLHGYPSYVSLVDTLPSSIERLELWLCNRATVPHLLELLSNIHLFPHLKVLGLDMSGSPSAWHHMTVGRTPPDIGFTKHEANRFQELCEEAQIRLAAVL